MNIKQAELIDAIRADVANSQTLTDVMLAMHRLPVDIIESGTTEDELLIEALFAALPFIALDAGESDQEDEGETDSPFYIGGF